MSADSSAVNEPAGRVPEFFIVGHHKSGTTALYEMLRRHPQLYMPSLKEPRYFGSDLHALMNITTRPETFEDYLALFAQARPDQRVGEASPSYLRSTRAASEIAAVQPSAQCIAILREPASFVRSLHMQLVQGHVEDEKDLRKAIEHEQITRDGRRVLRYSDHIHYVEQLERFHAEFAPEQLLVLIYDDFRSDNEATLRRVLRFLEVDEGERIDPIEANPSVGVRSLRVDAAIGRLYGEGGPLSGAAKRAVRAVTSERVRARAMSTIRRRVAQRDPQPPDEALMADLRRRYAGEVAAVSEYLGRDLVALWGYDRAG
jgi:sulfotransferase family protein